MKKRGLSCLRFSGFFGFLDSLYGVRYYNKISFINIIQKLVELTALRAFVRHSIWKEELIHRYIKESYKLVKHLQARVLSLVLD